MDVTPLDYFDPDELCKFELFGLSNTTMVPVMITMTPTIGIQTQRSTNQTPPPPPPVGIVQATTATTLIPPPQLTPGIPLLPAKISQEQLQQFQAANGIVGAGGSVAIGNCGGLIYQKLIPPPAQQHACSHHLLQQQQHQFQSKAQAQKFMESASTSKGGQPITTATGTGASSAASGTLSCIPGVGSGGGGVGSILGVEGGSLVSGGCGAGCNALMMIGIGSGGGGGGGGGSGGVGGCGTAGTGGGSSNCENLTGYADHDEKHLKPHCNCTYMSFDSFTDYQTAGFGGLPDVTEHSNIRRTTSRQDSVSNSESADVSSLSKSKKPIKTKATKRKYCIFSLSVVATLIICAIASILVYQFYLIAPSRDSHDERLKIVRKILKEVPLIDGHNDLAWNVRKYAHSSLELLDLSHELDHKSVWHRPAWSQTNIPRLKQGLVGAQIWSAYVPCEAQGLDAVQLALEQIDIIHRFTELHPKETALVVSSQEILTAHRKGILASLIGIEGGHALGSSLGVLRSMHSLGARYLTLTHQCDTSWAGSSSMSMDKGLSTFGKAVIKEMNRLGMLIDLSHSSDSTARDVLEVTRAPVIFSHSVARSLCNSSRNVPDDILRAVADNGGLIMISFDSEYVSCGDTSTLQDVVAHIKYIRSISGIQHIGIGAGYDGIENPPIGLEDVSKYPNLFASLLEDPNWSEEDIAMLAGKNFIRVLKSVENVRDYWKRAAIPPVETAEPIKKSQCTYMSS